VPETRDAAPEPGSAQTLSQALRARRAKSGSGRAKAATPPPPRYAPPRRRRRKAWRLVVRTTSRLLALGVLVAAVGAVWFWAVKPIVQHDHVAEKTQAAAAAAPSPTLGTRLASLAGGLTPGLATSTAVPGLAKLHVSVVDASGPKKAGLKARRYLHQLGMHPVPLNTTSMRLKKSVLLYKPGWQTRGLAFARLLGIHANARKTLPGVPAREPLVLVIGTRGI
jgi:hypothetical protein